MMDKEIRRGGIGTGGGVLKKSREPLNSQAKPRWVGLLRRNRKAAVAGRFAVPQIYTDAAELIADSEVNGVDIFQWWRKSLPRDCGS